MTEFKSLICPRRADAARAPRVHRPQVGIGPSPRIPQ